MSCAGRTKQIKTIKQEGKPNENGQQGQRDSDNRLLLSCLIVSPVQYNKKSKAIQDPIPEGFLRGLVFQICYCFGYNSILNDHVLQLEAVVIVLLKNKISD